MDFSYHRRIESVLGAPYARHVPSLLWLTKRFWFYFFHSDYICFSVFLMSGLWGFWPFVKVIKGFLRYDFADNESSLPSRSCSSSSCTQWYSFVALWGLYTMQVICYVYETTVYFSPSIPFLPLNLLKLPGSAAGVTAKIWVILTTERPMQHWICWHQMGPTFLSKAGEPLFGN